MAIGKNPIANGLSFSMAIGHLAKASEDNATAMGYDTDASGDYSTVMGRGSSAPGNNSTAMGYYSDASGSLCTAIGLQDISIFPVVVIPLQSNLALPLILPRYTQDISAFPIHAVFDALQEAS